MNEPPTGEPPASIDSSEEMVAALVNTQLLAPVEAEEVRQNLLSRYPDARSLAQNLVDQSRLTPYQAERILEGRGGELILGGCRILEPLGQGGMGQVFKAEQCRLNRIVALKVIHPNCLAGGPDVVRRFQREACAAAALSHPNVITIYDAGQDGDTHFLIMEYAAGKDLAHLIGQLGPLPIAATCRLIGQAALGLQHAHERGMIHRDIKPSNLFVTRPGTPVRAGDKSPSAAAEAQQLLETGLLKILDMGLARFTQTLEGTSRTALTEDGKIIGTPDYIAPEQARAARLADVRSDIYSLGCAFYHALTGRLPFPEGSLIEKLLMHQLDEPEPAERLRPDIPPALIVVLQRMMAKKPEDRYQIPQEIHDALSIVSGGAQSAAPGASSATKPGLSPSRPEGRSATPRPTHTQGVVLSPSPQYLTPTPVPQDAPETASEDRKPARPRLNSWVGRSTAAGETATPARELMRLTGHKGCVVCVAFGPDRNTLASAGVDETIRVWDFSQGEPREMTRLLVRGEEISALHFTDRRVLAAGTQRGTVLLWDLSTGNHPLLGMVHGHRERIAALAASSDGRSLASAGADNDVHIWDLDDKGPHLRASLTSHPTGATAVAFAPDGKQVATGALDGSIRLWLPRRFWNRELAMFQPVPTGVSSLAFRADGAALASGSLGKTFHVWDVKDEGLYQRLDIGPLDGQVRRVLFPPGDTTLVTLDDQGRKCVWDATNGTLLEVWTVPIAHVYSYALTSDGRYLATGASDGRILVYRAAHKRKRG